MELRNYVVLMVIGIVAMVVMPVTPCEAMWTHLGSGVSGGSPDSDSDGDDGYEYEWDWSYEVTGISRGGDSGGSWAEASMTADVLVEVWSFNGSSVSESQSTGPSVYGDSYYADLLNPIYDPYDLDYAWDVCASGTVTVSGNVNYSSLDTGDTVDASSSADGDADGEEYGGGYASGSVSESSSGSASVSVYGEATNDDDTITETSTTYYASLDFTVDAYDSDYESGGAGNSYSSGGVNLGLCKRLCQYLGKHRLFRICRCLCGCRLWRLRHRGRHDTLNKFLDNRRLTMRPPCTIWV